MNKIILLPIVLSVLLIGGVTYWLVNQNSENISKGSVSTYSTSTFLTNIFQGAKTSSSREDYPLGLSGTSLNSSCAESLKISGPSSEVVLRYFPSIDPLYEQKISDVVAKLQTNATYPTVIDKVCFIITSSLGTSYGTGGDNVPPAYYTKLAIYTYEEKPGEVNDLILRTHHSVTVVDDYNADKCEGNQIAVDECRKQYLNSTQARTYPLNLPESNETTADGLFGGFSVHHIFSGDGNIYFLRYDEVKFYEGTRDAFGAYPNVHGIASWMNTTDFMTFYRLNLDTGKVNQI